MPFVHLHLHTEYSLLDGECRAKLLPQAVLECGQSAVAITDHGNMFGAVEFYRECKKNGVKPIIGCEVYVAPRTMNDKTYPADNTPFHLVLLVQNEEGYRNLTSIVSEGYLRGFYRKPRTDLDALRKHSSGLIALSGCMSGVIASHVLNDDIESAKQAAKTYKDIFGAGFFIEIQRNKTPEQNKVNTVLLAVAKEYSIPLVATNDVHYIKKEDCETQELLMAISTGNTFGNKDFALPSDEFYLKSTSEMEKLFYDLPEAVENTAKIAEACNFDFDFNTYHLPAYEVPKGYNSEEYLRFLAEKGLANRLKENNITDEAQAEIYVTRLNYELSVIHSMGFDDYFLVVWDFINFAKTKNIPVGPGRGSGVGSLAAYSLYITDVNPIRFGLLFERFLNPERASMPDIDVDFSDDRRGEVIDYVARKYGENHMAQIITFGTLQARAAVRDVGRALGMTYAEVDSVAKKIPRFMNVTLDEAMEKNPELASEYKNNERVKRLLDFARKLEGRPGNASTHASGVVITDKPITDYLPLSSNDGVAVTQFGMNTVADLGLLKMDFLGLRFLTVIRNAESLVQMKDNSFSVSKAGFDDEKTYDLLSEGKTLGIFQLESEGMRGLLAKLCPKNLEDIISVISIYRPGPAQFIDEFLQNRKNPESIKYSTPKLKEILGTTMGCMLYQEQVMQVFRVLAGYSYGRADLVRRAMAKKKKAEMLKEKTTFVSGCVKNNISEETANGIFDSMASFASYAFNKSHAAAYAVLAYRTAYLKAHYPKEYMCALMNSVMGDSDKINQYIMECKALGIAVTPPDVNESGTAFSITKKGISFGLTAIKNVGSAFSSQVEKERETKGAFISFEDFLCRTSGFSNVKMLQSIVLAGGCDCFGVYRSKMFNSIEKAMQSLSGMKNEMKSGQISLFESASVGLPPLAIDYPNINEYPEKDLLLFEKSLTGVYFSGHPLEHYAFFVKSTKSVTINGLYTGLKEGKLQPKTVASLVGQVKKFRKKSTKTNKLMGFLTFEDLTGECEVIVFPDQTEKLSFLFNEGEVLLITGEATLEEPFNGEGEDKLKIILRDAKTAVQDSKNSGKDIYLKITSENSTYLTTAINASSKHKGGSRLYVYYEETKKLTVSKNVFVNPEESLVSELKEILGESNVALK